MDTLDQAEATNFTTPARLMSDSTFLTDLEAELLEGIKNGQNNFADSNERDFCYLIRTVANLIQTNVDIQKLADIIHRCQIHLKIAALLKNLGEKSEHILTTSELLGFNCAYVTCDIAIRPEDEEQSLRDLGLLSNELGPILKKIICAKPPLVLDHCQLTPQARLSAQLSKTQARTCSNFG